MSNDYFYIKRCLELAEKGNGYVAPNPMVGAVLVYRDTIIGEGWHHQYGGHHAEVDCINSVLNEDRHLMELSTMYVSLEPCSHHGKTPPCADLIIHHKIKKVVIGCIDTFAKVNGGGIQKLQNAGIEVVLGDWQNECKSFNKRFFTFYEKQRPYLILKWAQTANKKIAHSFQENSNERLLISNDLSNRLVHKWRSEEAAIMIGKNTMLQDNPALTNRLWHGKNPVRIIIDKNLESRAHFAALNEEAKTFILNQLKNEIVGHLHFIKISFENNILPQIMEQCYHHNIQSILIEGGSKLLQSFIDENLWDECRVISNEKLIVNNGLNAPSIKNAFLSKTFHLMNDRVDIFKPDAA